MIYQPQESDHIAHNVYKTPLAGLFFIRHSKHSDSRGFYSELNKLSEVNEATGIDFQIEQTNLSFSQTGVGRGIHFENWHKLLTIVKGQAYCAWADFRPQSSTFGQTVEMTIDADNGDWGSIFVSKGIGNSFYVIEGPLYYIYAVDQLYKNRDTSYDGAVSMFDKTLNISWPTQKDKMILSERDQAALPLAEVFKK